VLVLPPLSALLMLLLETDETLPVNTAFYPLVRLGIALNREAEERFCRDISETDLRSFHPDVEELPPVQPGLSSPPLSHGPAVSQLKHWSDCVRLRAEQGSASVFRLHLMPDNFPSSVTKKSAPNQTVGDDVQPSTASDVVDTILLLFTGYLSLKLGLVRRRLVSTRHYNVATCNDATA
jgi:hypothetical protein